MATEPYRLHILNSSGHTDSVIDLYCDGEATAIHRARQMQNGRDVEIWHGDRRIAFLRHGAKPN